MIKCSPTKQSTPTIGSTSLKRPRTEMDSRESLHGVSTIQNNNRKRCKVATTLHEDGFISSNEMQSLQEMLQNGNKKLENALDSYENGDDSLIIDLLAHELLFGNDPTNIFNLESSLEDNNLYGSRSRKDLNSFLNLYGDEHISSRSEPASEIFLMSDMENLPMDISSLDKLNSTFYKKSPVVFGLNGEGIRSPDPWFPTTTATHHEINNTAITATLPIQSLELNELDPLSQQQRQQQTQQRQTLHKDQFRSNNFQHNINQSNLNSILSLLSSPLTTPEEKGIKDMETKVPEQLLSNEHEYIKTQNKKNVNRIHERSLLNNSNHNNSNNRRDLSVQHMKFNKSGKHNNHRMNEIESFENGFTMEPFSFSKSMTQGDNIAEFIDGLGSSIVTTELLISPGVSYIDHKNYNSLSNLCLDNNIPTALDSSYYHKSQYHGNNSGSYSYVGKNSNSNYGSTSYTTGSHYHSGWRHNSPTIHPYEKCGISKDIYDIHCGKKNNKTPAERAAAGYVGAYSPESRRRRVERFHRMRRNRTWSKVVKYDVRKSFADKRVRVKGRFVKKEDELLLREVMHMT